MAKPAKAPIVFVSSKKRQFLRSKKTNRKLFEVLEKAGVVDQYGDFLAAPSGRDLSRFERLASREATKANLRAHLQNQIQAHLSARLPLPPGYRQKEVADLARKLSGTLAWQLSRQLISGYSAGGRPGRAALVASQALVRSQSEVKNNIISVLSSPKVVSKLDKSFHEAFPHLHSEIDFQDRFVNLTISAIEQAVDDASVFDARLETSEEEGLRLNVFEVGAFRQGEEVYEAVSSPARVEKELEEVAETLIEKVNLEFDLSEYGISRFGEREAKQTSRWFAYLLRKPERAALHFIAPPLERVLYKKWKPPWLRNLEKTKTPAGTRKLVEKALWAVVRNRILTIPIFVSEGGRRYSLFGWVRDPKTGKRVRNPKTGKYDTYFTPVAGLAGLWKWGRHRSASLLDNWAGKKADSLFRQNFAKILGGHLRRKKKNGKDDKSTTLWWLAKGAGKAVWVVFKPSAGWLARATGLSRFQAFLVNKWYVLETGGGFWGGALRFLRAGRYWGGALAGGWKGGLGYGFVGYLITGNPYAALGVGAFGWLGKSVGLLASNPEFLAYAGQSGFNGWLAGIFSKAALPIYSLEAGAAVPTGEVFSLLRFPVKGFVIGGGLGYIIGGFFGYPQLGALIGSVGGAAVNYGTTVIPLVISKYAGPQWVAAHPWLKVFGILKYWKWGIVGVIGGYALGKYLGLPEWACILMAVGGSLGVMGVAAGAGKLLSRFGGWLVSKIPFAGILGKIFGFVGKHLLAGIFGFVKGFGIAFGWGVQMGLPPWACIILGVLGGLVGAGAGIGLSYLIFEVLIAQTLWPIISSWIASLSWVTISGWFASAATAVWGFFAAAWAGLAGLVTGSLFLSIASVVGFVVIIAIVVMAALVGFEDLQRWTPGPVQSRYLMLSKTVSEYSGVVAGDILEYTITLTARDETVTGIKLEDTIIFSSSLSALDASVYLDQDFDDDGFKMTVGPEPEVKPAPAVGYYRLASLLIWEDITLNPGESFTVSYQVQVHGEYERDKHKAIENTVRTTEGEADGHEELVGPVMVFVNVIGPSGIGSEDLLAHAAAKVGCLTPDADGVYNQYDPNCDALVAAGRTEDNLFKQSVENWGKVTCVNFILEALAQAGISPPVGADDAHSWYDAAFNDRNWWTFPNEQWALNQVGIGDIVVFSGGPYDDDCGGGCGHIGVIYQIDPDGTIHYYHANVVYPENGTINFVNGIYQLGDGTVYTVEGFIHPAQ